MSHFRLLYVLAAGIGCLYGSPFEKWRKNAFTVDAALESELLPTPSHLNESKIANSCLVNQLTCYGYPLRDVILTYPGSFEMSYDKKNRIPNWVLEHLTYRQMVQCDLKCRDKEFTKQEERLNCPFQGCDVDYSICSGFIKGQLAVWKNHKHSINAYKLTHYLSNMTPQVEVFNTGAWSDLECFCRYLTYKNLDVYVFTGPLFLQKNQFNTKFQVIGPNHVAVPTHFFKVVICEPAVGKRGLACYIMPNECISDYCPLSDFRVSLQELQQKAGILFFHSCEQFDDVPDVPDFRQRKMKLMQCAGLQAAI